MDLGRVTPAGPRALAAELRDSLPVPRGRDPAKAHGRRLSRARRRTSWRAVAAGVSGLLAVTVGVEPGVEAAEIVWGGLAGIFAIRALNAGLRWAELRRMPAPAPRPAAALRPRRLPRPPRDCPSRGPLDRLAERERALAGLLVHLGPEADEPRAVAADAAAGLRELGARVTAVDRARRGAPTPSLDAAVAELCDRLDAGVTGYSALVAAAADAVAAGATGDRLVGVRLTEATDSLAGLAAGLREVAG